MSDGGKDRVDRVDGVDRVDRVDRPAALGWFLAATVGWSWGMWGLSR